MSEYIIDWPYGDMYEKCFGYPPERLMGFSVKQPIVRCRDCKRFYKNTNGFDCPKLAPDGFCAWGERREP